jgi:hypothetical protein
VRREHRYLSVRWLPKRFRGIAGDFGGSFRESESSGYFRIEGASSGQRLGLKQPGRNQLRSDVQRVIRFGKCGQAYSKGGQGRVLCGMVGCLHGERNL